MNIHNPYYNYHYILADLAAFVHNYHYTKTHLSDIIPTMNKLYAFASDYDNTLYMHKLPHPGISRRDQKAIEAFQSHGGLFGLCTGRPYRGFFLDPVIKKLRIDFYIASTGAHILSSDGEILFEKTLDFDMIKELYASEDYSAGHSIQMDGDFYLISGKSVKPGPPVLSSLDEAKGHKIYEASFRLKNEEKAAEVTARINDRFGDTVTAFQNVRDIDVVAKGCSKGNGLTFIKNHFGIDKFGAMGDSLNDLPLLETADMGFTFKTAPESLQNAASHITKGVSYSLELFEQSLA